jgi:Holliday junction resolvase-like predicted endonuclease
MRRESQTEGVNRRARTEEEQKEKGYMGIQHSRTSKILRTVNIFIEDKPENFKRRTAEELGVIDIPA